MENEIRPDHYQIKDKFEAIEIMKELILINCENGFEGYLYGNILKYLFRYKRKNNTEDLRKAATHLKWLITELEN